MFYSIQNYKKLFLGILSLFLFILIDITIRVFSLFIFNPFDNEMFFIYTGNLELQKIEKPTYLNPFQKITYHYSKNGEIVVIDQQNNIFFEDQKIIVGNPELYREEGDIMSWYSNVGYFHVNIYFFILQYFLLIFGFINIYNSFKKNKQLKINFAKI